MNKIKSLIEKLFSYPFIRFIFVGGIATVVNYCIYLSLVNIDIEPNIAYLAAFAVSIVCNYFLSSYITFQVKPQLKRAIQFLGAHLINLCNELILLNSMLYLGINKFYAPLLVFLMAFPINFFIVRYALKGNLIKHISNWFQVRKKDMNVES